MEFPKPMLLGEIAHITGGRVEGDAKLEVTGIASLQGSIKGYLTFLRDPRDSELLARSGASAAILPPGVERGEKSAVYHESPDAAVALLAKHLSPPMPGPGVRRGAFVAGDVQLGEDVCVEAAAVIGSMARVGDRTVIRCGCYVGEDVRIGSDCLLHPNVTVMGGCVIGDRVIIHPGAVIGSDGFGYVEVSPGRYEKIAQLGNVVVGDDVEIGACTCIDRATLESTVIEDGVKLDNLVHVAHNVRVGKGTAMAAQVGIAGSSKVGAGVKLGGQVGVSGHVEIGDGAAVGAQGGVTKDIPPGKEVWGTPAREKGTVLREMAALKKLPNLLKKLQELDKERPKP